MGVERLTEAQRELLIHMADIAEDMSGQCRWVCFRGSFSSAVKEDVYREWIEELAAKMMSVIHMLCMTEGLRSEVVQEKWKTTYDALLEILDFQGDEMIERLKKDAPAILLSQSGGVRDGIE